METWGKVNAARTSAIVDLGGFSLLNTREVWQLEQDNISLPRYDS